MTYPIRFHRLMIYRAAAAALAFVPPALLLAPAPVIAQAPKADLSQAVAALRTIATLRADFIQTDQAGRSLRGVLTLKRPGKIRFQYQKGVPILIVSDGATLTFIDYQVRQVLPWPVRSSPLGALLDPNKNVMRFARPVPASLPEQLAIEVRDPKHPEHGKITMFFNPRPAAPGGIELSGWIIRDAQNMQTTVILANHRYGLAVSDNTFHYNDPRGSVRR